LISVDFINSIISLLDQLYHTTHIKVKSTPDFSRVPIIII